MTVSYKVRMLRQRCTLRFCGVPKSTPHSLRIWALCLRTSYEAVREMSAMKRLDFSVASSRLLWINRLTKYLWLDI